MTAGAMIAEPVQDRTVGPHRKSHRLDFSVTEGAKAFHNAALRRKATCCPKARQQHVSADEVEAAAAQRWTRTRCFAEAIGQQLRVCQTCKAGFVLQFTAAVARRMSSRQRLLGLSTLAWSMCFFVLDADTQSTTDAFMLLP